MDKKRILIVSVVLAVAAVVLIQLYTSSIKKKYAGAENIVNVVVARKAIPAGTKITREMLAQHEYHKDLVPKGAVLAADFNRIEGAKVYVDVDEQAPLLSSYFDAGAVSHAPRELSKVVLKGERAITLMVDEQAGVAGLLRPADHVDILGTFMKPGVDQKLTTITLLQNMPVLAVGSLTYAETGESSRSSQGYRSVTLSATLEEAELLIFAQQQVRLVMVLRNPDDMETLEDNNLPTVNFDSIFQPEVRKVIQAKRNKIMQESHKIEIVK